MRTKYCIGVLFTVLLSNSLLVSKQRGPSTPEERAKVLSIAQKLEASPLDKDLRKDREWALLWLIQVPDVSVKLCTSMLGNFIESKYKYSSEITAVQMLSSAAFVIEHPEKSGDDAAQYKAGVEGVLKAYRAILESNAKAKSKHLDDLVAKENQGELDNFISEARKKCK